MRTTTFALLVLGAALAAFADGTKIAPVPIPAIVDINNTSCPVCDNKVAADALVDWNGVRVHLCGADCKPKFEKNRAAALEKLGFKIATVGKIGTFVDVMNRNCPIMGKPAAPNFTTELGGVRVHYCCARCPAKGAKDPAAMYKTLGYGYIPSVVDLRNTGCPISGKPADPLVFGDYDGIRVRFCCGDCPAEFKKDPAAWFAKMGVDPVKLKSTVK